MPSATARIAKNTLMLYFRQIVIMLVSLYTVRVVLETLGTEDYGIYNVVGGVVVLFTFLNSAMTSATQRFLNFAMGQNDTEQVRDVYSASLVIHAAIAMVVVVLAETVGLWFFNTWLNIPEERLEAAFAVYHFSVVTTVIGILQVPYRATVIAHEKMSFFALLSIAEATLKLGVVLLLPVVLFDHLVVYTFLVFVTGITVLFIHKIYCNRTFETARFRFCKDKDLFRRLLGFSGWSVFGGMANLSREQGTNILLNIFHGVTVNAAMGIATQVNSAVSQFVGNFQTAFGPQIIKAFSIRDYGYFKNLIFCTSKASFCLMILFVSPLYINAEFVLKIWLHHIPEYAVVFTRLILISSVINVIGSSFMVSIQATGDIKKYEIVRSSLIFASLPLCLLFLWMGFSPTIVLLVNICLRTANVVWQMLYIGEKIEFSILCFLFDVIVPMLVITVASAFAVILICNIIDGDWLKLILSCITSITSVILLGYLIGLNKHEKYLLRNWLKQYLNSNSKT